VTFEEGKAFADAQGAGFCELSSKTRENIRRPFIEVVDRIVQTPNLLSPPSAKNGTLSLGNLGTDYTSSCPC
jgi:Ras-related protein Rab-18